jgi:hypothetical protein
MARRRVLALRALQQPSCDGRGARLRSAAFEGLDVAEAERFQRREIEAPDRTGDVRKRVRACIAELGSVRQLTRSDGVQHDDARARHAAILLPWQTSSDS